MLCCVPLILQHMPINADSKRGSSSEASNRPALPGNKSLKEADPVMSGASGSTKFYIIRCLFVVLTAKRSDCGPPFFFCGPQGSRHFHVL